MEIYRGNTLSTTMALEGALELFGHHISDFLNDSDCTLTLAADSTKSLIAVHTFSDTFPTKRKEEMMRWRQGTEVMYAV